MADTKRDDHEVSSIGEGEASHEMRVLASAREHLPAIPITGQGPPSFAQSEFYTVHFDLAFPPLAAALIIDLPRTHVDCPSPTP